VKTTLSRLCLVSNKVHPPCYNFTAVSADVYVICFIIVCLFITFLATVYWPGRQAPKKKRDPRSRDSSRLQIFLRATDIILAVFIEDKGGY
jgi:hypothetical protein